LTIFDSELSCPATMARSPTLLAVAAVLSMLLGGAAAKTVCAVDLKFITGPKTAALAVGGKVIKPAKVCAWPMAPSRCRCGSAVAAANHRELVPTAARITKVMPINHAVHAALAALPWTASDLPKPRMILHHLQVGIKPVTVAGVAGSATVVFDGESTGTPALHLSP
jgi:hypothetical protein